MERRVYHEKGDESIEKDQLERDPACNVRKVHLDDCFGVECNSHTHGLEPNQRE